MPTEMQTVKTTSDYHVAASEHLLFTNQRAFALSRASDGADWLRPSPHLSISGEVDVVFATAKPTQWVVVSGIETDRSGDSPPLVTLDPGAVLKVAVTGGGAIAFRGGGQSGPTFDNAGTIIVTADGEAHGLMSIPSAGVLINSGEITVTSAKSYAVGLEHYNSYGVQVRNSGVITVHGRTDAIGVDMGGSGHAQVFHNLGSIVAHDDEPAMSSVGVSWRNSFQPGVTASFVNDGTIEADHAVYVDSLSGTAAQNLITNNGRLIGEVTLHSELTFVNNGRVSGPIDMWATGSVYDGRLGFADGPITVGGGLRQGDTLLGGAGGETMTGGLGHDTISGGGGDDVIGGGDGSNQLDGGSGTNTLSFAAASSATQVYLAAGQANKPNGDADTFVGFTHAVGSQYSDVLVGDAAANRLEGAAGNDTIAGAAGDDTLGGGAGSNYLRGDDGADSIYGGAGFDDINGNKGDDVIDGGSGGGDWLVGGQGNDVIAAHASDNILYGNMGNDTLGGGSGAEILRGGQDNDLVLGGDGDDWIAGDKGADTLTGGAGADTFHTWAEAGLDRVTDFNAAAGDRVNLLPGTTYTLAQVGADTVIDMGAGNQMVLANVQLSGLNAGWIFGA